MFQWTDANNVEADAEIDEEDTKTMATGPDNDAGYDGDASEAIKNPVKISRKITADQDVELLKAVIE